MTVRNGLLTIEKVFDDKERTYVFSLTNSVEPPPIACAITSPIEGATITQGTPVTITGSINIPGTVVVKLGAVVLGSATVVGLAWSYVWTSSVDDFGDVGAQTINATATAATGGTTANATGIGVTVTSPYSLRDVSTRTGLNTNITAVTTASNNWTAQVARTPISKIKVAWTNWALSGVETASGGVMSMTAAVEFPLGGTITPLTWNGGSSSIAVASGLEGVTDLVTLPRTIPAMLGAPLLTFTASTHKISRNTGSWIDEGFQVGDTILVDGSVSNSSAAATTTRGPITAASALELTFGSGVVNEGPIAASVGGLYRIRYWQKNTVANCYTTPNGNGPFSTGLTAYDQYLQVETDYTQTADPMPGANASIFTWPARIMGLSTTDTAVCLLEDSRGVGSGEDPAGTGHFNRGQSARSLAPKHPLFRLGQAGQQAQTWLTSNTRQRRLAGLANFSRLLICLGINDFAGGRTAAQIQGDIISIAALFPDCSVYVGTVASRTTSTDLWATTANQTLDSHNTERVALNTWIRALSTATIPNFGGFLEIAGAQESALNSGKWQVNGSTGQLGFTTDGLHASETGDKAVSISIP